MKKQFIVKNNYQFEDIIKTGKLFFLFSLTDNLERLTLYYIENKGNIP